MDTISYTKSAHKKNSSQSAARRSLSCSPTQQATKDNQSYWAYQKHSAKENTKPQEIKLNTQQRAIKRSVFNYSVATKLYLIQQQKKQEEKLQKMIEEEEIRVMRKEMIPRAQLMPLFDRPFFPQRSNRPLTVPREPSFNILGSKCLSRISCSNGLYHFQATIK